MFRKAKRAERLDRSRGRQDRHQGHIGRGGIGLTRLKIGLKGNAVAAVASLRIQKMDAGDGFVRFTQTAGRRTGSLVENRTRQAVLPDQLPTAWTTLALAIPSRRLIGAHLVGASSFPTRAEHTVGREDSPAVVTAVETALERELSLEIMGGAGRERGSRHSSRSASGSPSKVIPAPPMLYSAVLEGVLEVVVAGKVIPELGPEAIGVTYPCRGSGPPRALDEVAAGHRRETWAGLSPSGRVGVEGSRSEKYSFRSMVEARSAV
jgi:hypothetical protein